MKTYRVSIEGTFPVDKDGGIERALLVLSNMLAMRASGDLDYNIGFVGDINVYRIGELTSGDTAAGFTSHSEDGKG